MQFKERILLWEPISLGFFMVSMLAWVVLVAIAIRRLLKRFDRIRVLRLAYECELAVGQELDQLMRFGFRVFHDVQAGKFNVDHLVIGPAGVFAVETKGRSKRMDDAAGGGKTVYRVAYENGVLTFPGWSESEPPKQAARQASWANKWLSEAVGFPVLVKPVVVLPGWYVENKDNPAVPVIASGYIEKFFRSQRPQALSPQQIQQISYQVDQKVRDLPPGEVGKPLSES
ncbi:MAG: nuclease-related domain-containing protein [Pseudomonadales bacterium]